MTLLCLVLCACGMAAAHALQSATSTVPERAALLSLVKQVASPAALFQTSKDDCRRVSEACEALERAAALDSVRTSVADNTAAIGENDEQLDTHAATLSTHADDIASSETTLTTHGGRLDTHEETIGAHTEQLATHEQSISSNGQRLDEHEPAVPVVESFTIMSATTNAWNRGVRAHARQRQLQRPAGLRQDR